MRPATLVLSVLLSTTLGCAASSGERVDLTFQGETRNYYLHVPKGLSGEVPLVVMMHGGGPRGARKGRNVGRFTNLNAVADREGFVAVYPSSLDGNWNDGRELEAQYVTEDVDDVGFIDAVIDDVTAQLAGQVTIDTERIVASGVSNGGFMTQRLLCERSERYAAGVTYIATMPVSLACAPSELVAVRFVLGTEDPLVPFEGGPVADGDRGAAVSSDEAFAFWSDTNGCAGEPVLEDLPDVEDDETTVSVESAVDCAAPVSRVVIEGGGHTFPGGSRYAPDFLIGVTSQDVQGEELLWEVVDAL